MWLLMGKHGGGESVLVRNEKRKAFSYFQFLHFSPSTPRILTICQFSLTKQQPTHMMIIN